MLKISLDALSKIAIDQNGTAPKAESLTGFSSTL